MPKKDDLKERVWERVNKRVQERLELIGFSDEHGDKVFGSQAGLKMYLGDKKAWRRIGLTGEQKNRLTDEGLNFVVSMTAYLRRVFDNRESGPRTGQKRPFAGLESALKAVERFYEKCGIETSEKGLDLDTEKKLQLICAVGRRPNEIQNNIDYVLRVQQSLGQQVCALTRCGSRQKVYALVTVNGLSIPSVKVKAKGARLYTSVTRSNGTSTRIRGWKPTREHNAGKPEKKNPPPKTAGCGKAPKGIELNL